MQFEKLDRTQEPSSPRSQSAGCIGEEPKSLQEEHLVEKIRTKVLKASNSIERHIDYDDVIVQDEQGPDPNNLKKNEKAAKSSPKKQETQTAGQSSSEASTANQRVATADLSDENDSAMSSGEFYDNFVFDDEFLKDIGKISKFKVLEESIDKLDQLGLEHGSEIAREVESEVSRLRTRLSEKRVGFMAGLQKRMNKLEQMTQTAPFQRQADKIYFCYGVFMVIANAYLRGRYPLDLYPSYVSVLIVAHMIVRHVYYFQIKQQFYLTDYCYLQAYVTLYLINVEPKNEMLLRLCFLSGNGAMAVSVWAFRNSFVLHRIDHLTSLCLHLIPLILTNHLRWSVQEFEAGLDPVDRKFAFISDGSDETWAEWRLTMLWYPLQVYCVWAAFNAVIQFVIFPSYIKRTNQITLFTSFYDIKWSKKLLEGAGDKAPLVYLGFHFLFYASTHSLAIVCWHSKLVSYFFATTWFACVIWNGACYYIDYFAKTYDSKMKKLDLLRNQADEKKATETTKVSKVTVKEPTAEAKKND